MEANVEESIQSQIAEINQRLARIEKSIETLILQTKSAQRISDIVYVKGTATVGSYAPSISQIVKS